MKMHTELPFEALIETHLLEHGGYEAGDSATYDRKRALLPDTLLAFIQQTQAKAYGAVISFPQIHGEKRHFLVIC